MVLPLYDIIYIYRSLMISQGVYNIYHTRVYVCIYIYIYIYHIYMALGWGTNFTKQ
jgi:hypothetical protein